MKTAIIIGGGPAGLTAAYELLTKTSIVPIIIEADKQVGGLSKTIDYKGNKIDIGGHRFFSKSNKVIDWWLQFLPLDAAFAGEHIRLQYQNKVAGYTAHTQAIPDRDKVMMIRKRKSRVYYHKKLFDYPLQLNYSTLRKLGLLKSSRICFSYLYAKIFPVKPEETLEEFFRNNFGNELYETFFKEYTEKVWGVPCKQLPASWGQQRVKNLNAGKLVWHAVKSIFTKNKRLDQKGTSTSLIEQFLYPKYGPGQMWEAVAEQITKRGGTVLLNTAVTGITGNGINELLSVESTDRITGERKEWRGDYFFSTMPVSELIAFSKNLPIPADVRQIAGQLEYRDFLIVGILADKLQLAEKDGSAITDNWIYIQDKQIRAGRLQFFHNWSPFMIKDTGKKWIGVEYFCNESDNFWQLTDEEICRQAIAEMESIGVLKVPDVKDCMVARVKKAYPSYYGGYKDFSQIQAFLNSIENLFPVGRNGMHRYNNSDHSMLTAMASVENIMAGRKDKSNIWEINTEEEYHEEIND
jgi:protoporphyrinogen oxidase